MEREKLFSVKMRSSAAGEHISGAETIVPESEVEEAVLSFLNRARSHSRGSPDFINIKVEEIKEEPLRAPLLPVFHLEGTPSELLKLLFPLAGIPLELGLKTYKLLLSGPAPGGRVMRGAMVVEVPTGRRLEPDKERGIRASTLGITDSAQRELKEKAGKFYTENLKDALILTSKINFFPGVLAELCVSDDPDYTTGYLSISGLGYFRLFNIKPPGHPKGGRAIFVKEGISVPDLISFLQKKPFLATSFPAYRFGLPETFRS
ncbi:6-carboxyhexanoate--CoA ligase [Thermovibrio sp.]